MFKENTKVNVNKIIINIENVKQFTSVKLTRQMLKLKHIFKSYFQMGEKNTMMVDGVECEIISTREKESTFKKSVPILHPFWAALFGFLNLFPGKFKFSFFLFSF